MEAPGYGLARRIPRLSKSEWRRVRFPPEYFFNTLTLYCYLARNATALQMPNQIQPGEKSRGGGVDGILRDRGQRGRQPLRPVRQQRRQAVVWQLELARQRLQRQRPDRGLQQLAIQIMVCARRQKLTASASRRAFSLFRRAVPRAWRIA